MSVKNQVGNIASYASGGIIPVFVSTGVKDIIDNMGNVIYQCGVEVNSLKYANTQLLLDRNALICKLNALINKEILSQHYIVPVHEGGALNYISLRNNGSSPSIARLSNFSIESVCVIEYDPLYGLGQHYCIFLSSGKAIMIPNL